MNFAATIISAGIGAGFFVAGSLFYYQPAFIKSDAILDQVFTTDQSRARAAVGRLLLDRDSAKFEPMRVVKVDGAKYVCGNVDAKTRNGAYAGIKAFVYTVSIDFARIDDDGEIAQKHDAFKTCPLTPEEEKIAKYQMTISPAAVAMLKNIQKTLPATDASVLTSLSSQMSAGDAPV